MKGNFMNAQKLILDCKEKQKNGQGYLILNPSDYGFKDYESFSRLIANWANQGTLGKQRGYHTGQFMCPDNIVSFYLAWSPKGREQFLAQIEIMVKGATVILLKKVK
jgi:hypothetical protein